MKIQNFKTLLLTILLLVGLSLASFAVELDVVIYSNGEILEPVDAVPFIITLPRVGTFPAPAEFVAVGAPPPLKFHATYVCPELLVPPLLSTVNPSLLKAVNPS